MQANEMRNKLAELAGKIVGEILEHGLLKKVALNEIEMHQDFFRNALKKFHGTLHNHSQIHGNQ